MRKRSKPKAADADVLEHWRLFGYVVLPGFFSDENVDSINQLIERAWQERHRPDNPVVLDVLEGPLRGKRMYFRDAPDDAKNHPYKLNDLYLVEQDVRDVVLDPRLVAILHDLIGGDPAVRTSFNFERGSQEEYHFDTNDMAGPRTDGLVVTSICLEDVHPDAGPLTYYPGSHEIPPYVFSNGGLAAVPQEMNAATEYAAEQLAARSLTTEQFHGHTGDVFIWHDQLHVDRRPAKDPSRTRKSLVTQYCRADHLELDSA